MPHMPGLLLQNQIRGTLLVALSGILYGSLGFLGIHLVNAHFSVENMLFWRFFIASLGMLFLPFMTRKRFNWQSLGRGTFFNTFIIAACCYSGSSAFYFLAAEHIGTGLAMVVLFSFPIFVALFAWLFSDWRISKQVFFSLSAIVIGLIFLKGQGHTSVDFTGLFYSIISAFFYALYIYGNRHRTRTMDTRLLTMIVCLGNTIIFLTWSLSTHTLAMPHGQEWEYIIAIGIIATALPIQLVLDGLRYINPVKASILSVLEPLMTMFVGLLVLKEHVSSWQLLGASIVLLGAILIQFERTQPVTENVLNGP